MRCTVYKKRLRAHFYDPARLLAAPGAQTGQRFMHPSYILV
jgi:hypothetical protein